LPVLEVLTVAGMAALAALDARGYDGPLPGTVAGVVGALAIARAARWGTLHTARVPLLWILHAGYAWIPIGLLFRAFTAFFPSVVPVFAGSLANHALTVGAIGSLTLGMMARVSLGHTGRLLVAPKPVVWAFGAITASALARTFGPLVAPTAYYFALVAAASLWAIAFLLFLVSYVPVLASPRVDERSYQRG
jgi:uncharacterized protein involved in response to NO